MKIIYKRLITKSGQEQDVLYVPGRCVMTHTLDVDTYIFSPKKSWLKIFEKAKGKLELELEVNDSDVDRLAEIGKRHIDEKGRLLDIDNEEFRSFFNLMISTIFSSVGVEKL